MSIEAAALPDASASSRRLARARVRLAIGLVPPLTGRAAAFTAAGRVLALTALSFLATAGFVPSSAGAADGGQGISVVVSGAWANCTEARAAGRENIHRTEADYAVKLDGDRDGIACESRQRGASSSSGTRTSPTRSDVTGLPKTGFAGQEFPAGGLVLLGGISTLLVIRLAWMCGPAVGRGPDSPVPVKGAGPGRR